MTRTLLFLALAGIGSAQQFGGGLIPPASGRDAGRPGKARPATASAPYWRGQYRCTMRTRIDAKGREWQGEECYWFYFGGVQTVDRESPTGPVATLHTPQPGRRSDGGVADGRSTPINRRIPADYDWVGARPGMVTASPMPTLQHAGWWKRHLADTALHLAATSADAASSWGRVELNPVLRSADGRFGAKGAAIKGTFALGVELVKWRLAKRHPRERWVRALSLGPAAAFGGVAARNWRAR